MLAHSLVAAFSLFVLLSSSTARAQTATPAEARAIAKGATIYGFPLVDNYRNGAYALMQFFPNGDMLFNSIGGPQRVKLTQESTVGRQ